MTQQSAPRAWKVVAWAVAALVAGCLCYTAIRLREENERITELRHKRALHLGVLGQLYEVFWPLANSADSVDMPPKIAALGHRLLPTTVEWSRTVAFNPDVWAWKHPVEIRGNAGAAILMASTVLLEDETKPSYYLAIDQFGDIKQLSVLPPWAIAPKSPDGVEAK